MYGVLKCLIKGVIYARSYMAHNVKLMLNKC